MNKVISAHIILTINSSYIVCQMMDGSIWNYYKGAEKEWKCVQPPLEELTQLFNSRMALPLDVV